MRQIITQTQQYSDLTSYKNPKRIKQSYQNAIKQYPPYLLLSQKYNKNL